MVRNFNRIAITATALGLLSGAVMAGPYPLDQLQKMLTETTNQLVAVEAEIRDLQAALAKQAAEAGSTAGQRPLILPHKNSPPLSDVERKRIQAQLAGKIAEAQRLRERIDWIKVQIVEARQNRPGIAPSAPTANDVAGPSGWCGTLPPPSSSRVRSTASAN